MYTHVLPLPPGNLVSGTKRLGAPKLEFAWPLATDMPSLTILSESYISYQEQTHKAGLDGGKGSCFPIIKRFILLWP